MNETLLNKARLNVVSLNKALINGAVERHGSSAGGGGAPSKYIRFADPAVEAVLMAKGVSSDGVGITKEDAAAVTSIGTWFRNNATIQSFNELQHFTGVTTLLGYAFGSCTALTSIDLRNVVTISNYAFNGCTSLQSIGSTDKVVTMDGNAFYHAKLLDDAISLPNCTTLGASALRDAGITALYAPLVKNIPMYLCETDKALARIDISGAETIGQNAFNGCSALTNIGNLDKVVSIGGTAFRETGINSDVSVPSCTTLSAAAFRGCAAMTGIYAPACTFLGNYSFAYCTSLKFAEFGELTTIEVAALNGATSLERVIIRATTPPALGGISAFQNTNNCPIYVPDASVEAYRTATNWSSYADRIHPLSEIEGSPYIAFEDPAVEAICVENWSSDGIGLTKEDAAAVTDIGDKFKNNTEIVSFDEFRYFTGVTKVGAMLYYDSGFRGCTNLERITLPDSVVDLGYNSFYNTKISTINMEHVVRMHAQVFFNCANLSGDIVAESLTTMIGEFQFYGTSINSFSAPLLAEVGVGAFRKSGIVYANNLGKLKTIEEGGYGMFEQSKVKEVTFPATVETLGAYTCQGANSLQRIRCYAVTPPYLGTKAFEDSGGAYIYVPDASVEAYKTATNWADWAARIYAMKYSEPSYNIAIGSIAIMYSTINQSNAVMANSQFAITDYVPVTGGDKVTWGSAAARAVIVEVDENYAVVDYWSATGASRTITTNSKTKYVRTAFVIPAMESSYILNETTGEYLFKGKEV